MGGASGGVDVGGDLAALGVELFEEPLGGGGVLGVDLREIVGDAGGVGDGGALVGGKIFVGDAERGFVLASEGFDARGDGFGLSRTLGGLAPGGARANVS